MPSEQHASILTEKYQEAMARIDSALKEYTQPGSSLYDVTKLYAEEQDPAVLGVLVNNLPLSVIRQPEKNTIGIRHSRILYNDKDELRAVRTFSQAEAPREAIFSIVEGNVFTDKPRPKGQKFKDVLLELVADSRWANTLEWALYLKILQGFKEKGYEFHLGSFGNFTENDQTVFALVLYKRGKPAVFIHLCTDALTTLSTQVKQGLSTRVFYDLDKTSEESK